MENSLRSLLRPEGEMTRENERYRVTRIDADLATRIHVYMYTATIKGEEEERGRRARRKSEVNLLCSRIKMPSGRVVKFTLAES